VDDVRPTGLGAGGMRAVKLTGQRDRVVGAGIVDAEADVWVCTDTGVAKHTPVAEYPVQGRGGQGVITMKLPKDAGGLAAVTIGKPDDNIVLVTNKGKPKYMRIGLAPQGGRSTKGDYVISMGAKETAARVVRLEPRIEIGERNVQEQFAAEDSEDAEENGEK
jgi:DNA gyrase subunit A